MLIWRRVKSGGSSPVLIPMLRDRVGGWQVAPHRCNWQRLRPPGRLSTQPREVFAEMARGHPVWKRSMHLGHWCDQDKQKMAAVPGFGQRNAGDATAGVSDALIATWPGLSKYIPGLPLYVPCRAGVSRSVLSTAAASVSRHSFYEIGRKYGKCPVRSTVNCFLALVVGAASTSPGHYDSPSIPACLAPSTPPPALLGVRA
jgi:hypothetical protein